MLMNGRALGKPRCRQAARLAEQARFAQRAAHHFVVLRIEQRERQADAALHTTQLLQCPFRRNPDSIR